jgi:N6-L-threonylcarbamoyladenine synthase
MLLAFETSCDETSAAVVHHGQVFSNIISSQVKLHAEYGGVVPELAAREHLRNLPQVARSALQQAQIEPKHLDAIAATQGPGLPNALIVGLKAAQSLAFALRKPFLGVNHHEAHLYSPWIHGTPPRADFDTFEPNLSLIVSGGHTMLVHVRPNFEHTVLGSTLDDAAGECFDKAGKLLGLPYPGGPEIDRLAQDGNPDAFDFPRPLVNDPNDEFSFSGLKTSIRYFLRDHPEVANDLQSLKDLCASIQSSIVDVLVTKTVRAAKRLGVHIVTASGGVTCNRALRQQLAAACQRVGLTLLLAPGELCTDNAAMIGVLAERKLLLGVPSRALDGDIMPNWEIGCSVP